MHLDRLFADLGGQLDDALLADRDAEVAERLRIEQSRITLTDRLLAHDGFLSLILTGGRLIEGRLLDAGAGWVLIQESPRRPVLVATTAIVQVDGLGRRAQVGQSAGVRLSLSHPLRRFARDRESVAVEDVVGRTLIGTIGMVGADAFELAQHPRAATPRRREVTARPWISYTALICVTAIGGD